MRPIDPRKLDLSRLAQLWNAGKLLRDDSQRNDEALAWLVTSKDVKWFQGPKKSLWYLTNINRTEHSAGLHVLNVNPWTWKNFDTSFLAKLMDAAKLRKLYVLVPRPAKPIKRLARMLRFRHEGSLRESVSFGGRLTNLEIFGLLRREVKSNGKGATIPRKKGRKGRPEKGSEKEAGQSPDRRSKQKEHVDGRVVTG